jgi:hypothetical protein
VATVTGRGFAYPRWGHRVTMNSDERSSGEPYPGPEPSESSEQSSESATLPGERERGQGDREPPSGVDEIGEVGEAAASFGPRLGRRYAGTEAENAEPAVEPPSSD